MVIYSHIQWGRGVIFFSAQLTKCFWLQLQWYKWLLAQTFHFPEISDTFATFYIQLQNQAMLSSLLQMCNIEYLNILLLLTMDKGRSDNTITLPSVVLSADITMQYIGYGTGRHTMQVLA